MNGTTTSSRHRRRAWLFSMPASLFLHIGCTPDEQQSLVDSVGAALGDEAVQLIGFAAAFARSLLAAFLF
ncbi:MAG TPA: hypothetical protein VJZ71_05610 [Phycisphaerae bacterium]|nr:hypothetical protein [Phycisphaerae bacterium]